MEQYPVAETEKALLEQGVASGLECRGDTVQPPASTQPAAASSGMPEGGDPQLHWNALLALLSEEQGE